MTLRTRLALAAGVAVALAIAAAAIVVYFAVRGELRGEIDDSLRERATIANDVLRVAPRFERPPHRPSEAERMAPRRLLAPPDLRPPAFGGAPGVVQLIRAGATQPGHVPGEP